MLETLPLDFYLRPSEEVAHDLVGCWLLHETPLGRRGGVIVETEGYADACDPASHAYRQATPRNRAMFGEVGRAYLYFIYGNHFCFNTVAHPAGRAGAVLVRALEPRTGIELMQAARSSRGGREGGSPPLRPEMKATDLCSGPGKLCQALGLDASHYGADLRGSSLWIAPGTPDSPVLSSARIGIRLGRDLPWRFSLQGNPHVSKARP